MEMKRRFNVTFAICRCAIVNFWALFLFGGKATAQVTEQQTASISTPHTSLVYKAEKGQPLKFVYFGERVSPNDLEELMKGKCPNAFPVYGKNDHGETALSVVHSDGSRVSDLVVEAVSADAILLKDTYYDMSVTLRFKTYPDNDVIETWAEVRNGGKETMTLTDVASAYLPVRKGDVWITRMYGAWANECQVLHEPLQRGLLTIQNTDGIRNSHLSHAEVMLSLDGKAQEQTGRVIGAALCYTGNYRLRFNTEDEKWHQFLAGINMEHDPVTVKRGEIFCTPRMALCYAANGMGEVSRQFHRWGRKYQLANGQRERKVLLNSWEGVYFGINEERMHAMMDDAAAMGCELFVMDDGWFGNKYRRNDTQGLGDWMVDTGKLPRGIKDLTTHARQKGISFGIWIEPEAVNTKSELFEKHPGWALKPMHHEPLTGRGGTQLTLDLSNPEVQEFVFNMVDTLLTRYPDIDYIKWDANAAFLNREVSHIAYHQGLVKTLQRIRAKYPEVTIQDCASGGGRVNWGYLPFFDEYWTSDNTDALQRLRIQYGTSLFFPAIGMASHISASPNHQTFRSVPLKFRIDVAMAGRMGMEIQPKDMTEGEKQQCRQAIEEYKAVRPVVQFGDLYRLSSPYEGETTALMYVSEDRQKAVCCWYKLCAYKDQHLPLLRLQGLDPGARYTIHELNALPGDSFPLEGRTFTGAFLMQHGVEMPQNHSIKNRNERTDYASRVFVLSVDYRTN